MKIGNIDCHIGKKLKRICCTPIKCRRLNANRIILSRTRISIWIIQPTCRSIAFERSYVPVDPENQVGFFKIKAECIIPEDCKLIVPIWNQITALLLRYHILPFITVEYINQTKDYRKHAQYKEKTQCHRRLKGIYILRTIDNGNSSHKESPIVPIFFRKAKRQYKTKNGIPSIRGYYGIPKDLSV